MDKLKEGSVVEYLNNDDDYKKAIIITSVAGNYYHCITFSGKKVNLDYEGGCKHRNQDGVIRFHLANSIDEYLASSR